MIGLGSGRIPISLTIVTTFVGLVTVMLCSVLAVGYLKASGAKRETYCVNLKVKDEW